MRVTTRGALAYQVAYVWSARGRVHEAIATAPASVGAKNMRRTSRTPASLLCFCTLFSSVKRVSFICGITSYRHCVILTVQLVHALEIR